MAETATEKATSGVVQAIIDNYGYSLEDAQAMYSAATSNASNLIDPGIVEAYEDSLAAVQEDIAERQSNIISDAVAKGLTEEQAQAAIAESKANIAAKVAELQANKGDEPQPTDVKSPEFIDRIFTPPSPETIASIGEGGIYDTHYGINRPAYMDALKNTLDDLTKPAPAPAPAPDPDPAPDPAPAPAPAPAPGGPKTPGGSTTPDGPAPGGPTPDGPAPAPAPPADSNTFGPTGPQFGGDFVPTVPETAVQNVPAGGVAVVNPSVPQTVVQQVSPVTYQPTPVTLPPAAAPSGPSVPLPTSITSPTTSYVAGSPAPMAAIPGTFSTPLATAGTSAVPSQVTYKTHYAGTAGAVPQTLVTTAPGSGQTYTSGYRTVYYVNDLGQRIMITEFNGQPVTYVPPGFRRENTTAMSEGGDVSLAKKFLGFEGPPDQLDNFLQSNPAAAARMGKYRQAMSNMSQPTQQMYQGGPVRGFTNGGIPTDLRFTPYDEATIAKYPEFAGKGVYNYGSGADTKVFRPPAGFDFAEYQKNPTGYTIPNPTPPTPTPAPAPTPTPAAPSPLAQMTSNLVSQTMQPIQALPSFIQPTAPDFIPVDAGQVTPIAPFAEAATVGTTQQSAMPILPTVSQMTPTSVAPDIQTQTDKLKPAQGVIVPGSTIDPEEGTSSLDIKAAQGNAIDVTGPTARKLETDPVTGESEIISGSANAETAAAFAEAKEAKTATPSKQATVQGQLEGLMAQFEGGNTPAWASGAMRAATSTMIARGLGASSMAGQAIIQAAMESALPIAQIDAATQAQFEAQNLSNRQQRAMLAAQQRAQFIGQEFDQAFQARVQNAAKIADVANMNFNSRQQIALEDSRAANTMELNNLSNRQAMVMAEAAALSQLDMANLSNRQQASVQNASNFLQMDMANLSNRQQTEVFKAQQNIQALFTDQAADNASEQFNATSDNQTNQFFANLANQTGQFNATQQNAMDQFNINSVNALREFNSGLQQQRDQFNAQNGLIIAQANAQWRQNLATLNTAAQNESNMNFAQTINSLTSSNLDSIWQRERDMLSMAFQVSESNAERANSIILQKMAADASIDVAQLQAQIQAAGQEGRGIFDLFTSIVGL